MDEEIREFEQYDGMEFTAFSRALLQLLKQVKVSIEEDDIEKAKTLLNGLIEDVKSTVEEGK